VLIRQYRSGTDDIMLEIPGGVVDSTDTDPVATGIRELAEETGYTGENAELIGWVNPNPAIQGNKCFFILIHNCAKTTETNFDACEEIETTLVDLEEVPKLLRSQKISHALVHCAFQYLFFSNPLLIRGGWGS
jgi:8-oxo-dGTP pyrophosphatase MutT (NUDIX family)